MYSVPLMRVRELVSRLGEDPVALARLLGVESTLLGAAGREKDARPIAIRAIELARRTDQPEVEVGALYQLIPFGLSGEFDPAEVRTVRDRIREIAPDTRGGRRIRTWTEMVAAQELDGPRAAIALQASATIASVVAESPLMAMSFEVHGAGAQLAAGNIDEAIRMGTRAIDLAVEFGGQEMEARACQIVATALTMQGRSEAAAKLMARAIPLAVAVGSPGTIAEILVACGSIAAIQARSSDAAWLFGAAQAAYSPSPIADPDDDAPGGHWRRARQALGPVAWDIARRAGALADHDLVIERALGAVRPGSEPAQRAIRLRHGNLTTREVEILTLVGEGRTDAEIGKRLFISPKTASVHVANAKAKVGATSRLELALLARDMGLVAKVGEGR